jgi:Methyltransferase domain
MPGQDTRARRSAFFATCPAGLARILREQLAAIPGVEVTGSGSDGQADYVLFDADRDGRVEALRSRLAADVFADAGRASRAGITDAALLAGRCWRPDSAQRALSVWAGQVRPLGARMTFRVTTRVQTGPRVLRAGLRGALTDVIQRDRPRWSPAGQAQLEIWLSEWRDGELVTGLLLSRKRPGGPGGDVGEVGEVGEVGPVAAAMVHLAGDAAGVLLDPCCGTGVVLAEALAAGWAAEGTDCAPAALAAARMAAPGASVREGDAAEILEPDDSVAACVCVLPRETQEGWLRMALAEMSRVTRGGGAVVLRAPDIPRDVTPGALRLRRQVPVRLGTGRETIWVFRRA